MERVEAQVLAWWPANGTGTARVLKSGLVVDFSGFVPVRDGDAPAPGRLLSAALVETDHAPRLEDVRLER